MNKTNLPEAHFVHFNRILRVSKHKMSINSSHLLDFGALGGGLGHRGILGDLYFQKWAFRFNGSTIFETCTSKNGKRVTEGAYSFAWDEERAGEGVREDETRSQRKNNNALPDSFLYESLEAREQDGITAGEPESMSA